MKSKIDELLKNANKGGQMTLTVYELVIKNIKNGMDYLLEQVKSGNHQVLTYTQEHKEYSLNDYCQAVAQDIIDTLDTGWITSDITNTINNSK